MFLLVVSVSLFLLRCLHLCHRVHGFFAWSMNFVFFGIWIWWSDLWSNLSIFCTFQNLAAGDLTLRLYFWYVSEVAKFQNQWILIYVFGLAYSSIEMLLFFVTTMFNTSNRKCPRSKWNECSTVPITAARGLLSMKAFYSPFVLVPYRLFCVEVVQ